MKNLHYILILIILLGCSLTTQAQTARHNRDSSIDQVVQSYTRQHSAKSVGKVKITKSDVRGNWALIWAKSVHQNLDPAQYLLHKENRRWKVLTMGTALTGTGGEFNVPENLRRKWNL